MIRIITISIILLTLHSCTPARVLNEFTRPSLREPDRKEMRQQRREARKQLRHERKGQRELAKVLRKYPEVQRIDTIMAPISIITPERRGTITQPFLIPVYHTITQSTPEPRAPQIPNPQSPIQITFTDSLLSATFTFADGIAELGYVLYPRPETGTASVPCPTIQPTQYIALPLTWWQKALMFIGAFTIFYLIIRIPVKMLP